MQTYFTGKAFVGGGTFGYGRQAIHFCTCIWSTNPAHGASRAISYVPAPPPFVLSRFYTSSSYWCRAGIIYFRSIPDTPMLSSKSLKHFIWNDNLPSLLQPPAWKKSGLKVLFRSHHAARFRRASIRGHVVFGSNGRWPRGYRRC